MSRFHCSIWLTFAWLVGFSHTLLLAQVDEVAFIEDLRKQRLYGQIDIHCRDRLAKGELTDRVLVNVTVAWLRAATQRAIEAVAPSRGNEWAKLTGIASAARKVTISSRGVLIEIQLVLSQLARAEHGFSTTTHVERLASQAIRERFREAIASLRTIDHDVTKLLQINYDQSTSEQQKSGWTRNELESLRRNVQVQSTRAFRGLGLCFATGSADRVNALMQALEKLAVVVTLPRADNSVWQARVEQVVCLRLLERLDEARLLGKQWREAGPPQAIDSQLTKELQRIMLDSGTSDGADIDDPELLLHVAASRITTPNYPEAIAIYDAAAEKFAALKNTDRQFQAARASAALVRRGGDLQAAGKRYRQLALKLPQHLEAAAAHLVAIGLMVELARSSTLDVDHYVKLLDEHLRLWPEKKSADTVRWWLARHQISQRAWTEASQTLSHIDETSDHSKSAKRAMAIAGAALVREGDISGGTRLIRNNNTLTPENLLIFLESSKLEKQRDSKLRRETAEMFVSLVGLMATQQDSTPEPGILAELARHEGIAHEVLGRRQQALAAYHRWRELSPHNGEASEAYARLVGQSKNPKYLREALAEWQKIEERSEPGRQRWVRARQARVEVYRRLDQKQQAEKLLELTKILYPQAASSIEATR